MAGYIMRFSHLIVAGLALSQRGVYASPTSGLAQRDETPVRVPLRLMPLGASMTYGQGSSSGNGYRKDLRDLLVADGFTVDMVGTRKHGTMEDSDVEAWPGFRIEEILAKAESAVPSLLPNILTVNAGTNDCVQNYHIEEAGERIDKLVEHLWTASPNSTIILSTLLMNRDPAIQARVMRVNEQIKRVVTKKQSGNQRIVLVDMQSTEGPQEGDMADDTHPSDSRLSESRQNLASGDSKSC